MNTGTKLVGVVTIAAVIIGASIWLGRQSRPEPGGIATVAPPVYSPASPESNRPNSPNPGARPGTPSAPTSPPLTIPQALSPRPVNATPTTNAGNTTDWNEKIDAALKSGAEDREVAKSLLKSFRQFPKEGQEEAVQHISNLLPDEDYPELGKLMEDATLPEDVLDELIMDLLNRPNKIMLPELVKIARNPQHAKAGEAKDFLELYLEEDYGADWNLWQTKVEEWLKQNPND